MSYVDELLQLVKNFEQLLHSEVGPLQAAFTDADLGRPSRVQGELDPRRSNVVRLYVLMATADDHLRTEALKRLFETLDSGAHHFGARAQGPKDGRDSLPVGPIVVP